MSHRLADEGTPDTTGPTGHPRRSAADEAAARQHLHERSAFFVHAGVFAAGMIVIVLVNLFTNLAAGVAGEWRAWWSVWALLGWSIGLAVHGTVVRVARPTVDRASREQRDIDEILAR